MFADESTPLFTIVVPPQPVVGVKNDTVFSVFLVVGFSWALPVGVAGPVVAGSPMVLAFHHEVLQASPDPVT